MKRSSPKKIMIFGRPGSGKSTFALVLHKILNLSLYHLDKHFFVSNWVSRDFQEFLTMQQLIVDKPTWIIDENSTKSLEMRYAKADLVLYFNYSRFVCLGRIFKRRWDKNPEIEDRASGCKERLPFRLIPYLWTFEKRVESQLILFKEKYPNVIFLEIKNDKQLVNVKKILGLDERYEKFS